MEFVGVNRSPLVRQVNEAVRIVISKADCIMNSKTEFHQAPLVRIVPMAGLQEEQGTGRGSLQQGGVGRGRGGQGEEQGRVRRKWKEQDIWDQLTSQHQLHCLHFWFYFLD